MVEEISKNIQTMKRDILRLKEDGGLLPREEIERQKKVEDEKRIKIEMEIKRSEEEEKKKEEQELLRIRKEQRARDLEVDLYSEEETEGGKKIIRDINIEMMARKEASKKPRQELDELEENPQPKVVLPHVEKPKEITKEDLLERIKNLQKEKEIILADLKLVLDKKQPIEIEKRSISAEMVQVRKSFQLIILKEQEIENSQKDLEEKEILAKTLKDRKKIEKERWIIEEKRRGIEQQRWPWDQKIKTLDEKIEEIEEKTLELASSEVSFRNKIEEVNKREENAQKEIRRIELKEELKKIESIKINIEKEKNEAVLKLRETEAQLQEILEKEEIIEENKAEIEVKESEETDLTKKRELEKQRWVVEEKRRQIEVSKWKIDEEKSEISSKIEKINEKMTLISEKEKNLMQEIDPKEIQEPEPSFEDEVIKVEKEIIKEIQEPENLPEIPEEIIPVSETVDRDSDLEQAKRRIEMLRKSKEPELEIKPAPPEANVAKKELEKKDLDLKELEKQRLINQEERRKELLGRLKSPLKVQGRDNVLPKPKDFVKQLPKKPSGTEKIWLRILIVAFIVIVLTAILTFWYWYFKVKNVPEAPIENQIETIQPSENIEEVRTFSELNYIFDPQDEIIIIEDGEILSSLSNILQEDQINDTFIRVTFEGLGLREFNNSLSIVMPEEFYNKVENDFILFIYSQPQGKRLGIVAKTTDPAGLKDVLKLQETTMETNIGPLFELSGQVKPAIVSYFRNASDVSGYGGSNFRYKTVSKEDVGICYGLLNNYFILSSSWKSTETLLNKLNEITYE